MARTIRDAKLDTREARRKLAIRPKPYFRMVDKSGLSLGYRKNKGGGVWLARIYIGNEEYRHEAIGPADDTLDADSAVVFNFDQAQAKARGMFTRRKREAAGLAVVDGPYTVGVCIREYLDWMEVARKSARDARYRAVALILPALGDKACADLTAADIEKWRDATARVPRRFRTRKGERQQFGERAGDAETIRRRRASTNRTQAILKAALNRAWRAGKITSDDAWRRVGPFEQADAARVRYLSVDEGTRLINASNPEFRVLVRAALATGARYGELMALRVCDLNLDSRTLHVRISKAGRGRHIVLADEGVALFSSLAAGRPGDAPMLTKGNGSPWFPSHQARPMAEACARARIKPPANFHCLRHTYASHAIMNGAPLLVVAKNLGHSDTRMVERHYAHLAPSFIADAIRAAVPRFGWVEEKVQPLARVGASVPRSGG